MRAGGIIQPTGYIDDVSVGYVPFSLRKHVLTSNLSVGIRMYSNCFDSLLLGREVLLELIVQRDQSVHSTVILTCEGVVMAEIARVAAGKRYERGLTGEAGHGVPGVLLPSQTRCKR